MTVTCDTAAELIAAHIDGAVTERGADYARVQRPEDVTVVIRRRAGRLALSACLPAEHMRAVGYYGPWRDIPTVTVSADRPPCAIVDEFRRRLWPRVLAAYGESEAAYHAELLRREKEASDARAVAAELGTEPSAHGFRSYPGNDGLDVRIYRNQPLPRAFSLIAHGQTWRGVTQWNVEMHGAPDELVRILARAVNDFYEQPR